VHTTKEEYKEQGIKMMKRGYYSQAEILFENAGELELKERFELFWLI